MVLINYPQASTWVSDRLSAKTKEILCCLYASPYSDYYVMTGTHMQTAAFVLEVFVPLQFFDSFQHVSNSLYSSQGIEASENRFVQRKCFKPENVIDHKILKLK